MGWSLFINALSICAAEITLIRFSSSQMDIRMREFASNGKILCTENS